MTLTLIGQFLTHTYEFDDGLALLVLNYNTIEGGS